MNAADKIIFKNQIVAWGLILIIVAAVVFVTASAMKNKVERAPRFTEKLNIFTDTEQQIEAAQAQMAKQGSPIPIMKPDEGDLKALERIVGARKDYLKLLEKKIQKFKEKERIKDL